MHRGDSLIPDDAVHPGSREAWRAWLASHHRSEDGVWLVRHVSGHFDLTADEAAEEAVCFGWMAGSSRPLEGDRELIRFTARRPGTAWSDADRRRAEHAERAGIMLEAGRTVVAGARKDGSWHAEDEARALRVPDDLQRALDFHDRAAVHFEAFPDPVKRGFVAWVLAAPDPKTRADRVREAAAMARRNERVVPGS